MDHAALRIMSSGFHLTSLKRSLPNIYSSFLRRHASTEPKKIIFFLNLVGVGGKQHAIMNTCLFISTWTAVGASFFHSWLRSDFSPPSPLDLANFCTIASQLVMFIAEVHCILQRESIAKTIAQAAGNLSMNSREKLATLEFISCFCILIGLISFPYMKLHTLVNYTSYNSCVADGEEENDYLRWFSSEVIVLLVVIHSRAYYMVTSLYVWVFYAVYLQKCEASERLTKPNVNRRRCQVKTVTRLENIHNSFESAFSPLIAFITVFSILIHTLMTVSPSTPGPSVTIADLGSYLAPVCAIVICQLELCEMSDEICNSLRSGDTGQSTSKGMQLLERIRKTYQRPVTIWGMIDISPVFILLLACSLFSFSYLISA